jgi:glycosyltransferase involved in cell wall biosynthesis
LLISLIHPSRSRPQKSKDTCLKWISRAGCDVELIVSIDDNDPFRRQYLDAYSQFDLFKTRVITNPNRSAVDAVNNGAKEAKGDILIVVSDDSDCQNNWGILILHAVDGKSDYVLKTYDGVQKWIITMPVMDRAYYSRFGYIYHPDYRHMFVDTDFTHVADVQGKILWRNDIVFPHLHYSVIKTRRDEVSEKADSTWHQGKDLYLRRFRESFNLTGVDPWNVSSDGHKQWLREALRV